MTNCDIEFSKFSIHFQQIHKINSGEVQLTPGRVRTVGQIDQHRVRRLVHLITKLRVDNLTPITSIEGLIREIVDKPWSDIKILSDRSCLRLYEFLKLLEYIDVVHIDLGHINRKILVPILKRNDINIDQITKRFLFANSALDLLHNNHRLIYFGSLNLGNYLLRIAFMCNQNFFEIVDSKIDGDDTMYKPWISLYIVEKDNNYKNHYYNRQSLSEWYSGLIATFGENRRIGLYQKSGLDISTEIVQYQKYISLLDCREQCTSPVNSDMVSKISSLFYPGIDEEEFLLSIHNHYTENVLRLYIQNYISLLEKLVVQSGIL
jgi:hypothetical protein